MNVVIQQAPGAVTPPSLQQATADNIQAAASFQALLDPPVPIAKVEKQVVVSFDHLGMFGIHAGQGYANSASVERVSDASAEAEAAIPGGPVDPLSMADHIFALTPRLSDEGEPARAALRLPVPTDRNIVAIAAAAPAVAQPAVVSSLPPEPELRVRDIRSAGQIPLRDRPTSQAMPVVVVGGDGNAITIAARSWNGDEDGQRLRRRMQAVAAEFGLDISEFHLNGASIGPLTRQEG